MSLTRAHFFPMRLATVLIAFVAAGACGGVLPSARFNGHTMGTTYSVTVATHPQSVRGEAIQAVIDGVLDEVNRNLSTYDPRSEISRLNANATTVPILVSPTLRAVAVMAGEVSVATGGAFDITVGPLVQAWGFGVASPSAEIAPSRGEIERLRANVGFARLELGPDGRSLRKTVPGLQLDVNGIAPGHAVDLIAERLDALGVHDYLVELGGEVRAHGRSPRGRPWRVAVEAPLSGERRPYALVELDGLAVSTSGDYRDFREVRGRRFSHTIDPRSGAPVTHGLASVSVVHPSAAFADAYSTALMVLGPEEGMALAGRLGLAALFLERKASGSGFTERSTPAFERLRRPLR
jgi:FAD:protein FMN transferase